MQRLTNIVIFFEVRKLKSVKKALIFPQKAKIIFS